MIDMNGKKFGRLVVIGKSAKRVHGQLTWICRCECGADTVVPGRELRVGHTKSCGCLQAEVRVTANTKHGQAAGGKMGLVYRAWTMMKQRCFNPKNKFYHRYGGRGIRVCKRWAKSYEAFVADMGTRPPGCSLERRNNDGDYKPSNCYWATRTQQGRNKCNNRLVTVGGVTRCLSEWAEVIGVNNKTVYARLNRGWSLERAVSTPPRPRRRAAQLAVN